VPTISFSTVWSRCPIHSIPIFIRSSIRSTAQPRSHGWRSRPTSSP